VALQRHCYQRLGRRLPSGVPGSRTLELSDTPACPPVEKQVGCSEYERRLSVRLPGAWGNPGVCLQEEPLRLRGSGVDPGLTFPLATASVPPKAGSSPVHLQPHSVGRGCRQLSGGIATMACVIARSGSFPGGTGSGSGKNSALARGRNSITGSGYRRDFAAVGATACMYGVGGGGDSTSQLTNRSPVRRRLKRLSRRPRKQGQPMGSGDGVEALAPGIGRIGAARMANAQEPKATPARTGDHP